MFRRCGALLRRISYITDVEGDFSYFQRFVCISRVLQWEDTGAPSSHNIRGPQPLVDWPQSRSCITSHEERWAPLQSADVPPRPTVGSTHAAPVTAAPSAGKDSAAVSGDTAQPPNVNTDGGAHYDPTYSHLVDVARHRLTFTDTTSHFVFGGDAFDHGADLTFGHVLLDFKRRFPDRVHLLLGNRDVNKMVLYPRMAREVGGLPPDVAENMCFALPQLSRDAAVAAAMTEQLRYREYLAKRSTQHSQETPHPVVPDAAAERRSSSSEGTSQSSLSPEPHALVTDSVTFLQWTLKHKLGSPNAFDHRRQELKDLQALHCSRGDSSADVRDADVAASFFAAAQPGGVYYEYLRLGVLSVVLDGVLFVHGGVNGSNAGFVPSLSATAYAEQITAGEWWLPEVAPAPAAAADAAAPGNAAEANAAATAVALTTRRRSALEWLSALSSFKDAAFAEWCSGAGLSGEALRSYVYPRVVAPHSIAVGTVMQLDGPHHICLPAAAYLIESGIHTVCGGHQPVGDTPAVVRQPGGFMIVGADTSYCGRGNTFCTAYNRRGAAVMELVFDSGSDDDACDAAAAALTAHGRRADGAAFDFDLNGDLRVGRYVGDGWWVRLPPSVAPPDGPHAGQYELRRTCDGFRHEEVRWATADEVDAQLQRALACGQSVAEGDIATKYSKAELAEVRIHRIKTKVTRAS